MTIPYKFQIEGCTGEYSSEINGYIFTRTLKLFAVEGIGDDADIVQAFGALTSSNVPLVGTDLSGVDLDLTGCWMRNIKVTPLGNNDWRVVLQYQHSPFNQVGAIQVSSGTQVSQVESNRELATDEENPLGIPLKLVYKYPADYGGDEPTVDDAKKRGTFSGEQGGTYSKLVPEGTRTYTLREARDPILMRDIVGTINDADWLDADDKWKWMVTNVTGTTDDSLQEPPLWVNLYTFQYKKDTWLEEIVFVDSNTNEPVPDPKTAYEDYEGDALGSQATFAAYEEIDFSATFPEFT
jgi:hypothetical protein